jgi:hypothetical protein
MSEVKNPAVEGDISSGENTAEIIFEGKKYIIYRLKAGKFYEALKIYMDMIKEVTPDKVEDKNAGKQKETDRGEDKGKVKPGEVEVDLKKTLDSMFQSWPKQMVKFIAVCCSSIKDLKEPLTEEKIKEIAYPEEITKAFNVCLKLNNVLANLKNFAAPMGELGVGLK